MNNRSAIATAVCLAAMLSLTAIRAVAQQNPERQPLRVVLEESTGDWCGMCPNGRRILDRIEQQHGEGVIVLSYHGPSDEPLYAETAKRAMFDLGALGYPSGAVQRTWFEGEKTIVVDQPKWSVYTDSLLAGAPPAPVSIQVERNEFDAATSRIIARVRIRVEEDLMPDGEMELHVTAVLKQDSILLPQNEYLDDGTLVVHRDYRQMDVVRGMWPGPKGERLDIPSSAIVDGAIVAGTEIVKDIEFTVDIPESTPELAFAPGHASLVFLVHLQGAKPGMILQGVEEPLGSHPAVVREESAVAETPAPLLCAPNPAHGTARLDFSLARSGQISLALVATTGEWVLRMQPEYMQAGNHSIDLDISMIPDGLYFVELMHGGVRSVRSLIIAR